MLDHYYCEQDNGEDLLEEWRVLLARMVAHRLGVVIRFSRPVKVHRFWSQYRFLEAVVDHPERGTQACISTALCVMLMFPVARAGEAAETFRALFGDRAAEELAMQALSFAALIERIDPIDPVDRSVVVLMSVARAILAPAFIDMTWARLMTESVDDVGDATYDQTDAIEAIFRHRVRQTLARMNAVG